MFLAAKGFDGGRAQTVTVADRGDPGQNWLPRAGRGPEQHNAIKSGQYTMGNCKMVSERTGGVR